MKRSIILLITCTLAMAVSAQNNQNQQKKKKGQQQQQQQGTATGTPQGKPRGQGSPNNTNVHGGQHHHTNMNQGTGTGTGTGNAGGNANTTTTGGTGQGKHHNKNASGNVNGNQPGTNINGNPKTGHVSKQQLHSTPQWQAKHLKAQNIHQQHLNFKAQQNALIPGAKFNANYKIVNAQHWHGSQYIIFQNYHPIWHDQLWWTSHHTNILLIAGGWYYWNAGYWFPAWGYDPGVAYYPYDGPIYVGSNPTPPDQVIADVQAALQDGGFYKGEVDGLLGPLTRAALAAYQEANGLEITSAMDEPTLESLGMS